MEARLPIRTIGLSLTHHIYTGKAVEVSCPRTQSQYVPAGVGIQSVYVIILVNRNVNTCHSFGSVVRPVALPDYFTIRKSRIKINLKKIRTTGLTSSDDWSGFPRDHVIYDCI